MSDPLLDGEANSVLLSEAEFVAQLDATPRTLTLLVLEPSPAMQVAFTHALGGSREHWDATFVATAAELRARIERPGEVDVLLADVHAAPALASLLSEVELRDGGILRVVLGHPEDLSAMADVAASAHRFVPRPVDVPALLDDLAATVRRRELASRGGALRLALGDTALPSSPTVWMELERATQDPNFGAADLAAVVEREAAVCAKALQLANSAWLGLPRRISRIEDAVVLIGARALKGLVLAAEVSASLGRELPPRWLARFEARSAAVGRAARIVAPEEIKDQAMVAGLLHDVGTLVLMRHHPQVMRVATDLPLLPRLELERDLVGANHAEVGGLLLAAWGLPDEIADAVAGHHSPWVGLRRALDLTGAVHVGEALVTRPEQVRDEGLPYLDQLGADDRVEAWLLAVGRGPVHG